MMSAGFCSYTVFQKSARGSHRVMQRRSPDGTTTVPVPLHRELKRGTLMSIIRQSSLPRELFEQQS
jgi:predicted RNA binding protein YcfA (HicA-like mRNA interferase family)